jgi:hypothetical protein
MWNNEAAHGMYTCYDTAADVHMAELHDIDVDSIATAATHELFARCKNSGREK